MSRFVAALFTLVIPLAALAAEGTVYGKGVTQPAAVKLSDLLANPDAYVGRTVRIEGLVTDVCPKRGCWLKVAGDKEFQTIRFKVKDGEMVFPMSAKGRRADVEGVFTKLELSHEDAIARAKHAAEEAGKPFDPKSVKGPEVVYQLQGTGAVIR